MRLAAAAVLAAGALLAAPAGAQDGDVKRVHPDPRVGKPYTTFLVRFHPVGPDTGFGGDQLWLNGPDGTRCESTVVFFPVGVYDGKHKVWIGPTVEEDYDGRRMRLRPKDPRDDTAETDLRRWCRGVYRGGVDFEDSEGDSYTHTRFSFRVR